jgi:hypothetical protein
MRHQFNHVKHSINFEFQQEYYFRISTVANVTLSCLDSYKYMFDTMA